MQEAFEGVEDLGAPSDGLFERWRFDGADHKFLKVEAIIRMEPSVDDVHHRNGEDVAVASADIAVEGKAGRRSPYAGQGERGSEDGIGTEAGFVGRPIGFDHESVKPLLIKNMLADQDLRNGAVDMLYGCFDSLFEVAFRILISELEGFMLPCGGTGGDSRFRHDVLVCGETHLERRLAARVENL